MKIRVMIVWTMATLAAFGDVTRFDEMRQMSAEEAREGRPVSLGGIVTFAWPGEGFVLATSELRDQNAVLVRSRRAVAPGDAVAVTGRTVALDNTAAVEAHDVALHGHVELPEPELPKWSDVRKGWRHLRRGRCRGEVQTVDSGTGADGEEWTYYTIFGASVRVRGRVVGEAAQPGAAIEADGITRNSFDESGRVLAAWFEIASPDDVRLYAPNRDALWRALVAVAIVALAALSLALAAAWLNARRKRRELAAVLADRRRIAADLHDTIEQHLAGARILLDGALRVADVPDGAAARIRRATEVLANAKLEVREAVTGLRAEADALPLADALRRMAEDVTATGAAEITVALDEPLPTLHADERQDLLLIVREAVTNAVKHGRAKRVLLAAEPLGAVRSEKLGVRSCADSSETPNSSLLTSNCSGFALRILNNGAPFDAAAALGPETGHFGLAGMRERAARHGWRVSFGCDGDWTVVKLGVRS